MGRTAINLSVSAENDKNIYYSADVAYKKDRVGAVVYMFERFSLDVAIGLVRSGADIWTANQSDAHILCMSASGGSVGPEAGEEEALHDHLYGKRAGSHIFFGYGKELAFVR